MPIQFQDESVSIFLPLPLSRSLDVSPRIPTSFHLPPCRTVPILQLSTVYLYFSYIFRRDNGSMRILYANKCIFSLIKRGRLLRNCRTCNEVFQLQRVIDSISPFTSLWHLEMRWRGCHYGETMQVSKHLCFIQRLKLIEKYSLIRTFSLQGMLDHGLRYVLHNVDFDCRFIEIINVRGIRIS